MLAVLFLFIESHSLQFKNAEITFRLLWVITVKGYEWLLQTRMLYETLVVTREYT